MKANAPKSAKLTNIALAVALALAVPASALAADASTNSGMSGGSSTPAPATPTQATPTQAASTQPGASQSAPASPTSTTPAGTTTPATAQGNAGAATTQTPSAAGVPGTTTQVIQFSDREVITRFPGWNQPAMARVAVHDGRALLSQLDRAHLALTRNRIQRAGDALYSANQFAQSLQLMIPYTVVANQVRNAQHKLTHSATGIMVDDLLPIYANLDEMAKFSPDMANRTQFTIHAVSSKIAQHAGKNTQQQPETMTADISASTVYMPVLYIQHQIQEALSALHHQHPQAAQTSVERAMTSLAEATVSMYLAPQNPAGQSSPNASAPAPASTPAPAAHKSGSSSSS